MVEPVVLVIKGRYAGRNEHDKANRSSKYVGAALKKSEQKAVVTQMRQQCKKKFERIKIDSVVWYEPNRKRDPDNVASAIKVMLDALVESEIIPNDGWKQLVPEWYTKVDVDNNNPRVEITFTDAS